MINTGAPPCHRLASGVSARRAVSACSFVGEAMAAAYSVSEAMAA